MPALSPDIDLVLQAGYIAFGEQRDLAALKRAVKATATVALPPTLEPVHNAAIELLTCFPSGSAPGPGLAGEGWIETLRQQLSAHLNAMAVAEHESAAPLASDWERFRAKYSRPATEAAMDTWRNRADLA